MKNAKTLELVLTLLYCLAVVGGIVTIPLFGYVGYRAVHCHLQPEDDSCQVEDYPYDPEM